MASLKGGNVAVRILLAHGEKIGMFLIAICAGMLFWSALNTEQLGEDRQPDKLVELASRADNHVKEFKWEELEAEDQVRAEPISSEAMTPVSPAHFPPLPPINRPVLDPVRLRTDPGLLTVEDLEVHGDSGLWASANPKEIERMQIAAAKKAQAERLAEERERDRNRDDAEEGPRRGTIFSPERGGESRATSSARRDGPVVITGRSQQRLQGFEQISAESWVTVLAKVPIKKQNLLYENALQNSSGYDPGRDAPNYLGYLVERAEVTEEGDGEWKRIAVVRQKELDEAIESYPFDPMELISSDYLHPLLTHPLPPLVLRDWDRRVTHSAIPLLSEETTEETIDVEQPEESDEPVGEDNLFTVRSEDSRDELGRGYNEDRTTARRGFPGGRMPGPGGYSERFRGEEEMYGRPGEGEGYGREGGRSLRRGGSAAVTYVWDGETEFLLFRYFDNKVNPGHQYRYRVRLAIADVNHDVPEKYLDKTVIERQSKNKNKVYQLTDWSEPSPVASVPLPARVYLASAETANASNFDDEAEANILVKVFNSELPAEIARLESFLRGSVINVEDKASVIWADRPDQQDLDKWNEDFVFRTGVTVIDFLGGEKLSRDLTVPARAVFMDPAGRLFLQDELDDSEPVTEFKDALEGGQDNRPFGGGFEGGRERFSEGYEGR